MRNLILAGAAGLVLALTGTAAFAIPRTGEIMAHSQMATDDQAAVGAFAPSSAEFGNPNAYPPAVAHSFGGQGADTGVGPGAGGGR